jgi:Cys-tRNA(Pro) deacylase
MSPEAQQVQQALDDFGLEFHVVELPDSTKTAQEAADAIGCELGQIAKSLVFENRDTGDTLLVIASGSNRVDVKRMGRLVGANVRLAPPQYVLEKTGFVVGGVPPVGHPETIPTYIDADLEQYDEIWAAAGTEHAVFRLTPEELREITNGEVIVVT